MKKLTLLMVVCLLFSLAIPAFAEPTEEEIGEAFSVAFEAYFMGAIMSAFGMEIPGVSIVDEDVYFDNVDIVANELSEDPGPYTHISGTIAVEDDTDMVGDLTLKGGPIKNLEFRINDYSLEDESGEIIIIADGFRYDPIY